MRPGNPHPRIPLSFSRCLLGGGSQPNLVRGLTVPVSVTLSVLPVLVDSVAQQARSVPTAACTHSVRKGNVTNLISNKTNAALWSSEIFTPGLDFDVSWFLTIKRCQLNKNLTCL